MYKKKFESDWIKELDQKEATNRVQALKALGNIQPSSEKIVNSVIKAAEDKDTSVRIAAITALGEVGTENKKIWPTLEKALSDPEFEVRRSAVEVLGLCGSDISDSSLDALISRLKDTHRSVREAAAEALAEWTGDDAISPLEKALKDDDMRFRREVIYTLGLIGEPAEDALPEIHANMSNPLPSIRRVATVAAVNISPDNKDLKSALLKQLKDKNLLVRVVTVESLRKSEWKSEDVITEYLAILKNTDEDDILREAILQNLKLIGPDAKAAIPTLIEVTKEEDSDIVSSAEETLATIRADKSVSTKK